MAPGPSVEAVRAAARTAVERGNLARAAWLLERVVAREPRGSEDWHALGRVYEGLSRTRRAVECFRTAAGLRPRDGGWRRDYAHALHTAGRYSMALAEHRRALRLGVADPAMSWASIADLHETMRQAGPAREAADRALVEDASCGAAMMTLARLAVGRSALDEACVLYERVVSVATRGDLRASALHGLGAVEDRRGAWALAFELHGRANALKLGLPAVRAALRAGMGEPEAAQTAAGCEVVYRRWRREWASDEHGEPVFLVGFPRSGTTMVEQILAAAPGVRTTEEEPFMAGVRASIGAGDGSEAASSEMGRLEGMDAASVARARGVYWDEVWDVVGTEARDERGAGGERATIVDKSPLRILDAALIGRVFPASKMVVVIRDPRDCCLSCFFQDFGLNPTMVRLLDLEELGRTYARVMGFWLDVRDRLAVEWMEVRYEGLVGDFEATARGLLEFVGVEWSEDVMRFHERAGRRAIGTPSREAVTERVHGRAIGRWRHYREQLAPLLESLRPFVEAFGYDVD